MDGSIGSRLDNIRARQDDHAVVTNLKRGEQKLDVTGSVGASQGNPVENG